MFRSESPRVRYELERVVAPGHSAGVPSFVTSLLADVETDSTDEPAVRMRSDNYLILHQKDLENRIGIDGVRRWVDAANASSPSQYQSVLDKLSDRDLFSLVRSRHMQAPSEIRAYSEAILADAADLAARRADLVQRKAALDAARKAASKKDVTPPASATE